MAGDADLLAAWQSGDTAAGNTLLSKYYGQVLAFFRLRATPAADDLAQRTMLACTEARHRIASSSFRGFVFGVARRQLLKYIAERERNADDPGLYFQPGTRPASVLTPSGAVALRQEHFLLMRALQRLDSDHQTALALYYVQGLSTAEIGDVFEVSPSTVTSRLHRARAALRTALAETPGGGKAMTAASTDLDAWMRSLGPVVASLDAGGLG